MWVESLNEKSMCEASVPGRLDSVFSVKFLILLPQLSCTGLRAHNEEVLEGEKSVKVTSWHVSMLMELSSTPNCIYYYAFGEFCSFHNPDTSFKA